MSLSTKNVCKEIAKKKATFKAEMAKLTRKEKEATEKEEEAACNTEAAWLAAKKPVRKEVKKGEKHVVEESGVNAGADSPKSKKRAKTTGAGGEDDSPLETAKVSCKR